MPREDWQITYTAAMNLAQWLDINENRGQLPNASRGLAIDPGTPRHPFSDDEIATGLTLAREQADAEGVTPEELEAAQDALATQLRVGNYAAAGGPGYAAPGANDEPSQLYELGFYDTHPSGQWSEAEISAQNTERLSGVEYYKKHFV